MKKMMAMVFGIIVLTLGVLVFAKDLILKTAIEQAVTIVTGFKTSIAGLKYDFPATIQIKGLTIKNPKEFQQKVFVDIPEIFVSVSLRALLKEQKVYLRKMVLHIQEVHVEKNKNGISNIEKLASVGASAKTDAPAPRATEGKTSIMAFQLDRLDLTIRKVGYEDHSSAIPTKLAVDLNVQNQIFQDIRDPQALVNLIVVKILREATLGRLLDIDPSKLAAGALTSGKEVFGKGAVMVAGGVGTVAGQGTELLKESVGEAKDVAANTAARAEETVAKTASAAKAKVSGFLSKLKA